MTRPGGARPGAPSIIRLDYALSVADTWRLISSGIWAGTTPKERAAWRRQHPRDEAAA